MPDGPRYDDDFFAWTQYQAQVLRTLRTRDNRFDREHVAEEIEDLGKSERNAVRSQVRRILVHFLNWPIRQRAILGSTGWIRSSRRARRSRTSYRLPCAGTSRRRCPDSILLHASRRLSSCKNTARARPLANCQPNVFTASTKFSPKTGIPSRQIEPYQEPPSPVKTGWAVTFLICSG